MNEHDSDQAAVAPARPADTGISRRTLLGVGVVALPCLAGSTLVFDWLTKLGDTPTTENAEPIVARYDPTAHRWGFVVDTNTCIGCGLCVVACKDENNVPKDPEYSRTWVERHTTTADGAVHIDAPDGGIHGYEHRHGPHRGRWFAGHRRPLRGAPVHAVRELAVHERLSGRRDLPDRRRRRPRRRGTLHRLRVLRRRLPVRGALHRACRGRHAAGRARRRRQVHLLLPPDHHRPPSRLRGGVPGRRADVRRPQRPDEPR